MSLRLFWSAVLVLGFASSVFAAPQSADAQPQRASADRDQQVPADIDNEHAVSTATKAPTLAVPRLVRFNGLLTTGPGQYSITFALYKDQQGGDALWQETRDVAVDATGHYSVMLGATQIQGIPVDVFANGEAKWLGIQVRGDAEQPRLLMVSVPYALKAEEADRLGGRSASDFLTKDEAQTTLKSAVQDAVNQAVSQTTARQDDTTATNNASIKITPGATQQGTTAAGAVKFTDTSANEVVLVQQSGTGVAVNAITSGTAGVQATTTSSSGTGVYGTATAATGNAIGVRGDTAASNGQGVLGFASNAAGSGTGVQGTSAAATGTGVQGVAQGSSAIGVRATASGTAGANTGLLAETFSSTGTAGSFNATSASATLLAGKVNGATKFAVDGNGNITAAGGLSLAGPFNAGSFTGAAGNFSGSSPTQIITITQTGTGTAAVYNNTGGGAILSGLASGTEIFRVDQNPTGAVVLATQNAPGVANPSVTGPLPPAAIEGVSTSNSNISVAVMGIAHGNQSVGVLGINDSTVSPGNNNGTAVLAINENPTGKGVEVNMDDTTGTNTGVDVRLQSPNATGFNIDIPGGGTGSIFRAQAGPQGQQTTVFSIDNAGAIHFADGSTLSTANGAGGGSTFNGGTVSGPTTFQSLASFNAGASFNSAPATGSFSGSFSGDGSGLGNVNASALNGLPGTSFANLQSPNVFNALNTFNSGANFIGQVNATTLTTQQLSAQNIGDAGHGIFVSTTTDPQNGGNPILVQAGPGNGNGVGGSIQIAAGSGDGVSGNGGGSLVLLGGNGNNANNTAAVGGTVIIEAGSASAIGAAPSDIILAPGSVPTAAGPGVYGNVIIPQGGLQFPDGSIQTTAGGSGGSTNSVFFTGNNTFQSTSGTAVAVVGDGSNAALNVNGNNGPAAVFSGNSDSSNAPPVVEIDNTGGVSPALVVNNSSSIAATFSGDIYIDGSGNNASLNVMNPSGGDIFSAMNDASIEVFAVGPAEARVGPTDNAQNVATFGSGASSFPLNINSLAYNSEFSSADPHTWSITASPVNGFPTSSDLNVDLDGKTVSYVFGGDGTLHAAAFQGDGSQLTGVAAANTANTFLQLNTFQGGISTTNVSAATAPGSALSVNATAGLFGANSNGGDLNLNAGGADLNDGFSGQVNINAGSGNTGGNVNITAGHGRAGNSAGNIYLNVGQNDNGDLGQVLVNGGLVTNNPTGVGAAISATGKDVAGFGEPVHLVGDVNGQAFSSANGDTLGRIVRFEQINNPFVDGTVSGTFGSSRADLGFDQNGNFFITRDLSNATPAISVDVNNNVTIAGFNSSTVAHTDTGNTFLGDQTINGSVGIANAATFAGAFANFNTSNTAASVATATEFRFAQIPGDETNAGVIDYRNFDPSALSIIGAGTTNSNRLVDIGDNLNVGLGGNGTLRAGNSIFSGNVGIGTSTPGTTLDLAFTGPAAALRLRNTNSPTTSGQQAVIDTGFSDSRRLTLGSASDSGLAPVYNGFNYMQFDGAPLTFISGQTASNVLTMQSNGFVGIGTSAPSQPLEVAGTVKATSFLGDGSQLTGIASTANANTFTNSQTIQVASASPSLAVNQSGSGAAVLANSTAGGPTFLGQNGGTTTFSVDALGDVTALSGTFQGVNGGIFGYDTNTAPGHVGVTGKSDSPNGSGVQAISTGNNSAAVFAVATDTSGVAPVNALHGKISNSVGATVFAEALSTSGNTVALQGQNSSTAGTAVLGQALATTGTNFGVRGALASATGSAVRGDSNNTGTSSAAGVTGFTASTANGIAVDGFTTAGSTNGIAVRATGNGVSDTGVSATVAAAATSGTAVSANALATTGNTKGVIASVFSATGTTAVLINNTPASATAKVLSGRNNSTETFALFNDGSAFFSGNVTAPNIVSATSSTTFTGNETFSGTTTFNGGVNVNAPELINASAPGNVLTVTNNGTGAAATFNNNSSSIPALTASNSSGTSGFFTGGTASIPTLQAQNNNGGSAIQATTNNAASGQAIFGFNANTTGAGYGIYGASQAPDGTGIRGDGQGNGNSVGVYGVSFSTTPGTGTAGLFQNNSGGDVLRAESGSGNALRVAAGGVTSVVASSTAANQAAFTVTQQNGSPIFSAGTQTFNQGPTYNEKLRLGYDGVLTLPVVDPVNGGPSGALDFSAASSNGFGLNPQTFRWQAQPFGSFCDGPCPVRLTLLSGSDPSGLSNVLSINPDGTINFSPFQSFSGTTAASTTSQNTFNDTQTFNQAQFSGPALVVNDTFGGNAVAINHTGSSGAGLVISSDTEPLLMRNTANGGGALISAFTTDSSNNQFQVLNLDGTQNTCGGNQDPFSGRCGLVALPALGFADGTASNGYTSATLQLEGSVFNGSFGSNVEWNISADPVNAGSFNGDVALNFHRAVNDGGIPNNPGTNPQLIMSLSNAGVSVGGGTPIKTILLGRVSYTTSSTFSAGCDAGVSVVIPGAAPGDVVSLGLPPSLATDQFTIFKAWVTNNTDTNGNFFVNVSGCHFAAGSGSPTTDTINLQVTHFAPPTA